ncbi:MAG: class I SAM-dependent methyltransferase [Chitinophagales bacterium]
MKTVGSIRPSSPQLSREMASSINSKVPQNIFELGAGEGAITRELLSAMHPESKLYVFEINENFLEALKELDDHRLILIHDSAEFLTRHLSELKLEQVDVVVSALPTVLFDKEVARKIIRDSYDALRSGGLFVQFHYSRVNKKVYEEIFDEVKVKFIIGNLPPAFVYVCRKK